jgi:hypothetical protein
VIGYRHYAGVLGMSLPQTKKLIQTKHPNASVWQIQYETLTHGMF